MWNTLNRAPFRILFMHYKNPFIKYPSWNLGGHKITNAETLEILGTMFTSNISCDAHIDKRVNASRRAMYALTSVGCSYPGLTTEVKVHLWKTIGLPSLLYHLEIFKLKPGQQKFIESVQSFIIKRIVGFPKRSNHTALLQAVNIDDVMSSVTRNTLSLWWRLFQVGNPTRKLQIKLMKEFYNANGLIPGTILQRVVSAGFSPIKSLFTKQLNVNPEVNSPRDGVVDCLRYLICNENFIKPYSEERVLATVWPEHSKSAFSAIYRYLIFITIDKSVTPVWYYIFSVMVTAVFYCPFYMCFMLHYVLWYSLYVQSRHFMYLFSNSGGWNEYYYYYYKKLFAWTFDQAIFC